MPRPTTAHGPDTHRTEVAAMNTAARKPVWGFVAAAGVVLAGCGSGADESAPTPSSPPPASSSSSGGTASPVSPTTAQGQSVGRPAQKPAPQPGNGSKQPSAQQTNTDNESAGE